MMNLPLGEENATYEKELKKCWDEGFAEGRVERDRLKSLNDYLLTALESIRGLSRDHAKCIEYITSHAISSATEKDEEMI